jgi:pimeloyl-ACP methyl ester carboxylesterase
VEHQRVDIPPYSFWVGHAGKGTPVVLIHGLGGSSDWWRRNVEAFAAHCEVFAIDLVGFGKNRFFARPSRLPLRFDEMASVLARWIESSIGAPVHLVGNSMGGHLAIHIAALRPDLIRSLVLVDSTGIPFRVAPAEHFRNLLFPRGLWGFLTILVRDLFRAGPTSVALSLGRLLRDDARPLMRELRMPVLLVWGERDPLVPVVYAKEMLREIPDARLEVIPHASHIPMWENASAFNRAVLTFWSNVEDKRRDVPPSVFSWAISGWHDGVAHREAGRRRDIVLVHGLGMSGAYFVRLAHALFQDGWSPAAPDLRGFGESGDGPPRGPIEHATELARWADALGIRSAIWVGHSIGCNIVAELAVRRPDVVRRAIGIGPLWSPTRSMGRLSLELLADAPREPLRLFPILGRAYWRAGLARWFATLRRYESSLRTLPPDHLILMAGHRDPLPDRKLIPTLVGLPGAHACHFSDPRETAEALSRFG